MRNRKLLGAVAAASFALGIGQSANAALVVYYDFNGNSQGGLSDGASIINKAGGANGVFHTGTDAGGAGAIVASTAGAGFGNAIQLSPASDGSQNTGAPNIDTLLTATAANVTPGTPYTAMAWAKFASTAGDNMIFGQDGNGAANGGAVLHLGTRTNGNPTYGLHSGHWGDDIGPDQGVNVGPGTSAWHHVAYTNDGAGGTQSIYMDGNLIATGAAGATGAMDLTRNILIGTSNNGGSFSGQLDEVKIFNTLLSQSEIQAASQVPEPTIAAGAVIGGIGLLMSRRRRAE